MVDGIFENPWTTLGVIAAVLAAAAWLLGALWDRVLIPLLLRHQGELDDRLAHAARTALQALVFAGSLLTALNDISSRPGMSGSHAVPYLRALLLVATAFSAAWLCTRLIEELAEWYLERLGRSGGARLDQQLMPVIRWASRLAFLFFALTFVLGAYNIRVTALLGAAGVMSLAVAFAAQETLANMVGGLALMMDRPFVVGDMIELPDGRSGRVEQIGLRSTRLLTLANNLLVIPNAELAKQSVTNLRRPDPRIVVRQAVGVGYSSDLEKVRQALLEVMEANPRVLKDPPPEAHFTGFGDSALDMLAVYSVGAFDDLPSIRTEVNVAIKKRLDSDGVDIPFPQRVVHLRP